MYEIYILYETFIYIWSPFGGGGGGVILYIYIYIWPTAFSNPELASQVPHTPGVHSVNVAIVPKPEGIGSSPSTRVVQTSKAFSPGSYGVDRCRLAIRGGSGQSSTGDTNSWHESRE